MKNRWSESEDVEGLRLQSFAVRLDRVADIQHSVGGSFAKIAARDMLAIRMLALCAMRRIVISVDFAFNIWAHGVVVSHPLRMRKALGSNPSVSTLRQLACFHVCIRQTTKLNLPTRCLASRARTQQQLVMFVRFAPKTQSQTRSKQREDV